jgi:hypothetical protein
MGRDNPPKERQRKQLERKQNLRASYDRILIVSEGSKTEPLYFKEICTANRLQTANIEVQPSQLGTAPIQVVEYARALFKNGDKHKGIQPRAFEQVYAVFDRDDHDSYFDALKKAESLDGKLRNDNKQAVKFTAIASIPCFELWLLLHYEDIRHWLHRDQIVQRLKQPQNFPGYEKGSKLAFSTTRHTLDTAIQRARRLAEQSNPFIDTEPYTAIVELVELLTNLRKTTRKNMANTSENP